MIISVKEIRKFLICVLIPLLVGYSSRLIATKLAGIDTSTYYSQLIKPGFAPPSFVFVVVWVILYILMGISSYIVLKKGYDSAKVKDAMFYYWLQLFLNFMWSILFFGLDLRFTALIDLVILIFVVIIMMFKFCKLDKRAMYLNVPYLIWLLCALILNYFIWVMNK
ncbi:tryptophan-rich sensory protein [Romboutsia maritimum]|uniref:Tryptophan-rich sensory protein n=1 Tax=Romboutsia maritimum TaxID=2020948 RepID=A0A371IU25_9FIRM|nr:TspO/MBR family protein [Romboutsia maritimum]RDY23969.1 tryptophan-rich sensory protein [Romboutsia maritimum]